MRNIILCGFMGCGKSTVGRQLAELTGRQFMDMDELIANRSGMSVSDIFEKFGEEEFRRLEREVCAELSKKQGLVIAAGGGALTFPENVKALSETGDIVLLDVPLEVILKRLQHDTTRPLLARPDREEAARKLYNSRQPLYRAACGYSVDGGKNAGDVARSILGLLNIDNK